MHVPECHWAFRVYVAVLGCVKWYCSFAGKNWLQYHDPQMCMKWLELLKPRFKGGNFEASGTIISSGMLGYVLCLDPAPSPTVLKSHE